MSNHKMPVSKPIFVVQTPDEARQLDARRADLQEELRRLELESARQKEVSAVEQRKLRKQLLADAEVQDKKAGLYKQREDIDEALDKASYYRQLAAEIPQDDEIADAEPEPKKMDWLSIGWISLKFAVIIGLCSWAVIESDDWILDEYPQANVYNEVSFQKILFGFAVYIGAFGAAIVAFAMFFPGFGRYFNPFNNSNLDFFEDFKTLDTWKRNVIGFGLFAVLFLGFVLIVVGKLD